MFSKLSVFGSLFFVSACVSMIDVHGDAVDPERLASLVPQKTDYTEVQNLLGSPSSRAIFDSENWIYLHSEQKRVAFFKPKEIHRDIVVLRFDKQGILQSVETKTLEQGREITPSAEVTKTDQESLTVMDQMIRNVGRMGTDAPVH